MKISNKKGVLLAQIGSPDAPTPQAVRRYLHEFLSDPRMLETSAPARWAISKFASLSHSRKTARRFESIWKEDEAPLVSMTRRQAESVGEWLVRTEPDIEVRFGMRYGKPSLEQALCSLIDSGCTSVLLFPLFPQYSSATTGSCVEAVLSLIKSKRYIPALRIARPFGTHPLYLGALAKLINKHYAAVTPRPERLLLSYHGLPMSHIEKGDPYLAMCEETTQALLPHLHLPAVEVIQCFQSRFGRGVWTRPSTDEVVRTLAGEGIRAIAIACPGFVADCLETLDELPNDVARTFLSSGGESCQVLPCLNDDPSWIDGLYRILRNEL